MPNTHATALCPTTADQTVAMNRPAAVAARMIGSDAPTAVAGTIPTSTRPSATEPAMNDGRPTAMGSPAQTGAGAAAAAAAGSGVACAESLAPESTAVMASSFIEERAPLPGYRGCLTPL
jgi:hypothetical protein